MNVGRLGLDGFLQNEVNEADDRGQAGGSHHVFIGRGSGGAFLELAEEVFHRSRGGFTVDADNG